MALLRTITNGIGILRQIQKIGSASKAFRRYEHKGITHHYRNPHGYADHELDERYEAFFTQCNLDGWDMRQGMNELAGLDMVPSPTLIIAVLQACRRNNDYACAIRFLESVKDKCGDKVAEIYPYLIQEIAPVLFDLGVDTPEGLGYDKPELAMKDDTYD